MGRAEARQIDSAQQPDGDPEDQRSGSDIDTAEDHREDTVDILSWAPVGTEQEIQRSDLKDRGESVRKQEQTDDDNSEDRSKGCDQKDTAHALFSEFIHRLTSEEDMKLQPWKYLGFWLRQLRTSW